HFQVILIGPEPRRGVVGLELPANGFCSGDCARLESGPGIRIESVQNATDQATTAAKAICGEFKA
ncbi:hypothetical protein AB9E21_34780, partial [Rhizobium leguminosarum]